MWREQVFSYCSRFEGGKPKCGHHIELQGSCTTAHRFSHTCLIFLSKFEVFYCVTTGLGIFLLLYRACMKREYDFFVRVKVLAVEIASTIVFLVLVCWAAVWEIRHLFGR